MLRTCFHNAISWRCEKDHAPKNAVFGAFTPPLAARRIENPASEAVWRQLLRLAACALCFALALAVPGQGASPQRAAGAQQGQSWAFGHSPTRQDPLWQRGVDAGDIEKRARPNCGDAVDTRKGINRALNEAKKKEKSSLGVSVEDKSSSWKTGPQGPRADEFRPRERQHVVRAFADVKAGDDLDIAIGPELIVKDERVGQEHASEKQPDSSLGVGMRFKYDF